MKNKSNQRTNREKNYEEKKVKNMEKRGRNKNNKT
jgi:hypothetical protein